jgi:hypothetical protein
MKKAGDLKKQQKKHKNIQYNRDQIKLLKDKTVDEVKLFVLDPDGFKRVTIKRWDCEDYGTDVVYLHKGRKKTKLRTGYLAKNDYPRKIIISNGSQFVHEDDVMGVIVEVELLKNSELNTSQYIKGVPVG